jgi:stage II sporulation protein AA (anti-sigma F factor antagonist)
VDQEDSVFSAVVDGDDAHRTVVVSGEVDMATADAMYQAATRATADRLTIDLRDVTFFDSAAIHALVKITHRYSSGLSVVPSAQVRRVLEISGLGDQPWLVAS